MFPKEVPHFSGDVFMAHTYPDGFFRRSFSEDFFGCGLYPACCSLRGLSVYLLAVGEVTIDHALARFCQHCSGDHCVRRDA